MKLHPLTSGVHAMTIHEAFQSLTIEHIDRALAMDLQFGFPADALGLARFFLRTVTLLGSEIGSGTSFGTDSIGHLDAAIVERLQVLLDLEERRLGQLDEGSAPVPWVAYALN
jgi:hypothetical protein